MGKLVVAGPMMDNGEVRGIFIFKAGSVDEAKALSAADPAVQSGRLVVEILPWWSIKGIGGKVAEEYKKNQTPHITMVKYYLGILKKGPKWTAEATPEAKQMQLDHLWHIRRSLDSRKMAAAGPFETDGEWRGIIVLATDSLEEAKATADADPAVRAGHFVVELHPWFVAKEVWP